MSRDVRKQVREKYAKLALGQSSCCDPVTTNLYAEDETAGLPPEAVAASQGCGNPVALADLRPGETVLDLGSGAGLDVLLSARRVGPGGRVFGLDMTDEMLALARANQARAGVTNVEFLKGEIEAIPLPDAAVDIILSNCVVNLSTDKPRVFAEAFRVLRPGGRLAIHDIVVDGPVPDTVRKSMEAWTGCLAGALEEDRYRDLLGEAGFEAVSVTPTRIYPAADGEFRSAFIRATKPR